MKEKCGAYVNRASVNQLQHPKPTAAPALRTSKQLEAPSTSHAPNYTGRVGFLL